MEPNKLITYIEEIASEALRIAYTDVNNYIKIEALNLRFIPNLDYTIVARCHIDGIDTMFEAESIIGLPKNPFEFTDQEAFAFAINIANIISDVYKTNIRQSTEDIGIIDDETHFVC